MATVLVVDDEPEVGRLICDALADKSCECSLARDGLQAYQLLQQRPFDVVVADIVMPGMSGLELLEKVLACRPETKVILITGKGCTEWAKQAIRRGAFDYLEKPFSVEGICQAVEAALAARAEQPAGFNGGPPGAWTDHDPLTGLLSHRRFHEQLEQLRTLCRRHNQPLAILLMDVDEFQRANDDGGHAVGDAVLQELARRLRIVLRETDLLARYEGDAFIAALANVSTEQAKAVAERILAMARHPVPCGGRALRLTLSIGIAECESRFIERLTDVIDRAEAALAEAKRRGKNQYVAWADICQQPVVEPAGATLRVDPDTIRAMGEKFEMLQRQLKHTYLESTRAFIAAVEAKDPHTQRHSITVAHYAETLARRLGLPAEQIELIKTAALLHDIGKIGIPDSVLTKPGPLNEEEFELIRRHPEMAVQILSLIHI